MKHKRSIFILIMVIACTTFVFADFAISFGPAYTNYFVKADGKFEVNVALANVKETINNLKNEKNNAAGVALDFRVGLFYVMTQIAFPTRSHSDLWNNITNASEFAKTNSFIFDSQFGAGFTFFEKSRFNLFVGGGSV